MTNDNPKSKIPNPKSIDPALKDHLTELAILAREIGADAVWIVRGLEVASLNYIKVDTADDPALGAGGLLVVLRFPASDGGAPGVEVK